MSAASRSEATIRVEATVALIIVDGAAHAESEDHMKYALLVYGDEHQRDTMGSSERQAFGNACRDNDTALRQRGYLLAAAELQSSGAATVRMENGSLAVTAGRVVETREQLLACMTIQARDLNEAIQIAATMPQARVGSIEVRPLAPLV
jgi:hypothetical protein